MDGEQLILDKTEWLWLGHSVFSLSLVLNGVTLPQTDLGVLLDSRLLLEKQVAAVARRAFIQHCFVCQLHTFLDREAL